MPLFFEDGQRFAMDDVTSIANSIDADMQAVYSGCVDPLVVFQILTSTLESQKLGSKYKRRNKYSS